MPEPLFYEEQRFTQPRLRILTAIPPVAMTLLSIWQVGLGHKWGKQPMSNASIIGWSVFLWLIYLRLITIKLITEVYAGELRIAMRGLWRSAKVDLSRVGSARQITFDPVADWGGYGIRHTQKGRAYIAEGTQGVELKMSTGGVIVIGSKRSSDLSRAIGSQRDPSRNQ